MTIRKFQEWGLEITRPENIQFCGSDAEAAKIATHYRSNRLAMPHIHLTGGSMAISLGYPHTLSDTVAHELPIDLLRVRYTTTDETQHTTMATNSVVMRHRWWLGKIVAITNGGYFRNWEIAPRAHPNDGVFDVVETTNSMSYRQRLIARRRLSSGSYVPHPSIDQRQCREDSWFFTEPMHLYLDEEFVGSITQVQVTIEPDAIKLVI